MNVPDELLRLLSVVPALSRAYLVGGCVRDSLLGIPQKDFDLEVYGVDYEVANRAFHQTAATWQSIQALQLVPASANVRHVIQP